MATIVLTVSCDGALPAPAGAGYATIDDASVPAGVAFEESSVVGQPHDTAPGQSGHVAISGVGAFDFEPAAVERQRPELFAPGFFSVFDVLVHLRTRGAIGMSYRFEPELDTHVIESINGTPIWWYDVFYSSGWSEPSVHRMDYYPVKDGMHIELVPDSLEEVERRRSIWRAEVARRQDKGGLVVIPEVTVSRGGEELRFEQVAVIAHDLRADALMPGVVTAVDVILSLADQGAITYQLRWYERIGAAEIESYFVVRINQHAHSGRCGFVYEVGERAARGGSHVHIPPDMRILHSPEYALFYWIELGSC